MKRVEKCIGMALAALLCASSLVACGGDQDEGAQQSQAASSGGERTPRDNPEVSITGLMGTIPRGDVQAALNPRMQRFSRCFEQRMGDNDLLSGIMELAFRISTEGSVLWVYPSESDVGDREVERCVVEVAQQTRFPRPRGGEAEFSWGFGFELPEDVRPPLAWNADSLGGRADELADLAQRCEAEGAFSVTAYVQPGGDVLTAGGSLPDAESTGVLDCIVEAVEAWQLPDPGSYAAKVSFQVQ